MLISEDGREIKDVWHKHDYNIWASRLSDSDLRIIKEALNKYIDYPDGPNNLLENFLDGKRRIITSSWIPGTEWGGTPFQPIYDKACKCNEESSAKCFGLMVQVVIMERPETWMSGKYEMPDGTPIKGTTYFVVEV